jgi:hypothetical protein
VDGPNAGSLQFSRDRAIARTNTVGGLLAGPGPRAGGQVESERDDPRSQRIVAVRILALRPGKSPRLGGIDKAHVIRLTEAETPLPPILVDRATMRVIDGMHRLLAASLKGQHTIATEFFDGSPADAFLRAVEANVKQGLPLSLADRRSAAAAIIGSHPHMSDRLIAQVAGLAAKTVAAIRRRSTGEFPQLNARVGRDGRIRPLTSADLRRRVAELLAERPGASLREVARAAGASPATVQDVRKRLDRGDDPVPSRLRADRSGGDEDPTGPPAPSAWRQPSGGPVPAVVQKLSQDPSLRHTEKGRRLLQMLHANMIEAQEWGAVVSGVPPHCVPIVAQVARQYAQAWQKLADELDERARIIEPMGRGDQ